MVGEVSPRCFVVIADLYRMVHSVQGVFFPERDFLGIT